MFKWLIVDTNTLLSFSIYLASSYELWYHPKNGEKYKQEEQKKLCLPS